MDFNSATSNPRPSSMQMEGGMQGGSGLGQGVVREGMDEGFENLEGGQASGSGGGLNTGGPDAETFEVRVVLPSRHLIYRVCLG